MKNTNQEENSEGNCFVFIGGATPFVSNHGKKVTELCRCEHL